MSKAKLVEALLQLELYDTESGAISAWAEAWKQFFSNAFANYTQADPTYVVDQTSTLKIGVNSVLGAGDASGSWVKVECLLTGEFENLEVVYDTQNYVVTSGLLGQSSPPSTTVTDYEVTDVAVIVSALDIPEAAMASAMVGLSVEGDAANKLQDGVIAWWGEIVSDPISYFKDATAVVAPSGLSGLSAALESTFDANIAEDPPISQEDAVDAVADDFIAANVGGTVTIATVVRTIE